MELEPITSLFDLEQKSKINKYYRQLIISFGRKDYVGSLEFLYRLSRSNKLDGLSNTCHFVIQRVNKRIPLVMEDNIEIPKTKEI